MQLSKQESLIKISVVIIGGLAGTLLITNAVLKLIELANINPYQQIALGLIILLITGGYIFQK